MADTDVIPRMDGEEKVSNGMHNGISNGSSSHEHKHKHRDREREKHKSSHKDKDRDRDRHKSSHKDKDRDKDRHSSHKSSHKDKDRDKHRDKDREKNRDKEKHKERDREKDKHKSKDKERHEKHSSDKDRHKSDKYRDEKHKDSSRKHKSDKHSSDRDKHRSSDKDKHRKSNVDEDREKVHRKSSHKDKERDKERSKDRHSNSRVKQEETEPDDHDAPQISREIPNAEYDEYVPAPKKMKTENSESDDDFEPSLKIEVQEEEYEDDAYQQFPQADLKEEISENDDFVPSPNIKKESDDDFQPDDNDDFKPSTKRKVKKESDDDFQPDEDDFKPSPKRKVKKESDDDFHPDEDDFKPSLKRKVKKESDDEDFKPSKKRAMSDSDDDDVPLIARKKMKMAKSKPKVKKTSKPKKKAAKEKPVGTPKKKKKNEEEENVWKWWEEEKSNDGRKWKYLEHKGPVFADPYEPLPSNVKFYYNGEHVKLEHPAEEIAGFYARMLEHDYTTREVFNKNFFKDWRKSMNSDERALIQDLSKCNFKPMHEYFLIKTEERKNRTKEEKKALKEKNEAIVKEYGWCVIDKHKQRIGNFKIEPPGLFRGRGDHPKQGMVKRRIVPEDVLINCSRDSPIPVPPKGHRWKEVRHDPSVTWLCSWTENVQNQGKYVMLNAASKLKGEKDWQKYETARKLHKIVDRIRETYKNDFKSKEMRVRQRAVALYFIDKLALRAGNEKDEDQADTVGCCSLRVEHIKLFEEKDGREFVVVFDFLGKDSIRYYNEVPVEKRVFKNVTLFMENKQDGDDLFDRLNTQIMNKHLNELMEGLTAKVFRTYNASRTLQEQLDKLTDSDDSVPHKILSYNRANREVAILCNHQRAVPKTFDKSMANLQKKIDDKKELLDEEMKRLKSLKRESKSGSVKDKMNYDKKRKAVERIEDQLKKLEISATDKEENKQIALGTSKLNYLDPRISVAWCKRNGVPVEKIYNKTQRQKFQWAIDMATADYNFMGEPMNISRNAQSGDEEEEDEE